MKRTQINSRIAGALSFLSEMKFHLPPFARWTPEDWQKKGTEANEIVLAQLGWDITDFGSHEFEKVGLVLFTIRNGGLSALDQKSGKTYAEKILIVQENQITPTHFHYQKMEDIINRGGGELLIQCWNSLADNSRADTTVTVSIDGVATRVAAGEVLSLKPGDSICLPQRLYHKFWGAPGKGPVLVGEVSRVNDDRVDNYFYDKVGRFPEIEEDVAPLHLLTMDYPAYYRNNATHL